MAGSTEWLTPRDFYDAVDAICEFELDAAATHENALWYLYCTEEGTYRLTPEATEEVSKEDGFAFDWTPYRTFCNPPYSPAQDLYRWVEKGALTGLLGGFAYMVLPAFTDPGWFHDFIWDKDRQTWRPGVRGNFRRKRLKFTDPTGSGRDSPRSGNLLVAFGVLPDEKPGEVAKVLSQ